MGAMSTMTVSRAAALRALATIEHAGLDDDAVVELLNARIAEGGYSLDEVAIHSSGSDWDESNLERIAESIAR